MNQQAKTYDPFAGFPTYLYTILCTQYMVYTIIIADVVDSQCSANAPRVLDWEKPAMTNLVKVPKFCCGQASIVSIYGNESHNVVSKSL